MNGVKDDMFRSSELEITTFKSSNIWLDISDILNGELAGAYEALRSSSDMNEICRLQGCIKEIEKFLDVPDIMIETVVSFEKHEADQGEEEGGDKDVRTE